MSMIHYAVKKGDKYLSGLFSDPCEFKAHNAENGYRWNKKEIAEKVARDNDAKVVEVTRFKTASGYFVWDEFK